MKKLRDLIYDYNDIFVTLLIIAVAAAIIFWRVDGIMGYSQYLSSKSSGTEIDIDFEGVDLNPTVDDPIEIEKTNEGEDDPIEDEPIIINPVPDKNFSSNREVILTIPKGAGPAKIAGVVATTYGYENDDYKNFVTAFTDTAKELKLETKMHYGDFKIESGSTLADIIKKLAYQ